MSLLSDVASDYFQLLELDQELEIARSTTNSFDESLRIFNQRAEGGTASDLESSRAEAALADAMASIPAIEDEVSATENELVPVAGTQPRANPSRYSGRGAACRRRFRPGCPPLFWSAGRMCARRSNFSIRPTAQIGESEAEFFPQIGLTALLGKVSPQLSAFTLGGANAWGVAAAASGPLFEGGRLVGQYRQAKAARDEARLRFQQTALAALRDVSDALVLRERLAEIRVQQEREVTALDAGRKSFNRALYCGQGQLLRSS